MDISVNAGQTKAFMAMANIVLVQQMNVKQGHILAILRQNVQI